MAQFSHLDTSPICCYSKLAFYKLPLYNSWWIVLGWSYLRRHWLQYLHQASIARVYRICLLYHPIFSRPVRQGQLPSDMVKPHDFFERLIKSISRLSNRNAVIFYCDCISTRAFNCTNFSNISSLDYYTYTDTSRKKSSINVKKYQDPPVKVVFIMWRTFEWTNSKHLIACFAPSVGNNTFWCFH